MPKKIFLVELMYIPTGQKKIFFRPNHEIGHMATLEKKMLKKQVFFLTLGFWADISGRKKIVFLKICVGGSTKKGLSF